MSKFNSFSFSLIAALSLSSAAFAAPPEPTDNSEILAEKIEDKLADHQGDIARSAARLKRKIDDFWSWEKPVFGSPDHHQGREIENPHRH